jgi:peptidylprolyl isomerase
MPMIRPALVIAAAVLAMGAAHSKPNPAKPAQPFDLAKTPASDWHALDPENTVYLDLPKGRVVIELAADFAPNHAADIRALVRSHYFDDSFIVRSQENYVVQWAAPEGRKITAGHETLKAEFEKRIGAEPFIALPDPDTYAPQVGFSGDFPAARDPKARKTWPIHCYGMVGAGRDEGSDSGSAKELYAVIGQSPRNLDRNITVVGRVMQGMELLSVMPRGTGDLGFYKTDPEKTRIAKVRMAADLPASERLPIEALRTDSASFKAFVQSKRFRKDGWYKYSAGHIGVCNINQPVRLAT